MDETNLAKMQALNVRVGTMYKDYKDVCAKKYQYQRQIKSLRQNQNPNWKENSTAVLDKMHRLQRKERFLADSVISLHQEMLQLTSRSDAKAPVSRKMTHDPHSQNVLDLINSGKPIS